jgi:hypothetical protein
VKLTRKTTVLKETRPALAVRGAGCLMCHAQIQSNMITDFGHGDSYFLGNNIAGLSAPFYGNLGRPVDMASPNGPWVLPWQTAEITGRVLIPQVQITSSSHSRILDSAYRGPNESLTLDELISQPYTASYAPLPDAPVAREEAPMVGAEKLEVRSSVYIRAPSVSEIQNLVIPVASSGALDGFIDRGAYIHAQGAVTCRGAHKVDKPLLFENVRIRASASGCRIYSSKNIFIQGAIQYSGLETGEHLQLSSARGIYLGFDEITLLARMDGVWMDWAYTRSTPPRQLNTSNPLEAMADYSAHRDALRTDLLAVKARLVDAATPVPRPVVNFEHVILNAPHVHSRYHGSIKGTIIAEIALGEVNNFSFEYDPLFDSDEVELFPELAAGSEGPVLSVGKVVAR